MHKLFAPLLVAAAGCTGACNAQAAAVRTIGFDRSLPTWLDATDPGAIATGLRLDVGGVRYPSVEVGSEGLLCRGAPADTPAGLPRQAVVAPAHGDVDRRRRCAIHDGCTTARPPAAPSVPDPQSLRPTLAGIGTLDAVRRHARGRR